MVKKTMIPNIGYIHLRTQKLICEFRHTYSASPPRNAMMFCAATLTGMVKPKQTSQIKDTLDK